MNISLSPSLKGLVTYHDILSTEGTFMFTSTIKELMKGGFVFEVISSNFIFSFSLQNKSLVIQRNDTISILELSSFNINDKVIITVMWGIDFLYLCCNRCLQKKEARVPTVNSFPPLSIIKWARKENLISISSYENEEVFRNKVCSCLQSIQEKISEIDAYNQFWDFNRSTNGKIISRSPKIEIHVQPTIHSLLFDQMLMSSIDVIPEYETGIGNIDFSFRGSLKNGESTEVFVEFKNAHSTELKNGLINQLPKYMMNKHIKYGFYCILNYKGKWFDKPREKNNESLDIMLSLRSIKSAMSEQIRILVFNLSKLETASK